MDIDKNILNDIQALLDRIEKGCNVSIILAVESGSRAWGFPSKDSDYDIRFIYHRPSEDYISCFERRDVIDNIFEGDLDGSGWDLTKTLGLMRGGNASVFEWLNCGMVYREAPEKINQLREFSVDTFNALPVYAHYLGMVRKKRHDPKLSEHPKTFLYALRALLSAKWIMEKETAPPVEFHTLKQELLSEKYLIDTIDRLIEDKLSIQEGDDYAIAPVLLEFLGDEYQRLDSHKIAEQPKLEGLVYDKVLKSILRLGPASGTSDL